ncbi:porin family protein [Utexia brackfieldae]|uniref:outer membrane protein n=1 Tax=Utexia brackfieldae TaxID=3074108 RepID=UPI00370DD78A
MKLTSLATVVALAAVSASAFAADTGFYVGGKLGASLMESRAAHVDSSFAVGEPENLSIKNKTKTTFNVGASVGYDFNVLYQVPVRSELDYTYRSDAKIKTAFLDSEDGAYDSHFKIKNSTLMVNNYYDFYNSSDFTPYVGIGLGMSFNKYKFNEADDSFSKNKFAWAGMAGVSYKIDDNLTANVEYRYLDSGKIKYTESDGKNYTDNFSAKLRSHDLSVGLRYTF